MFEGFFEALGSVLNFFYTLIPNYGISIILLTVLVMVLITPLTVKSTRSMLQMQRLQPEMKRLQAKYKDDREQLNAELMKFYRENGINPLGGCLPILATMPVFFIMYRLLRGLTTREGGLGSGIGHIAGQSGKGQTLTPWILDDQLFRPEHLKHSTELYRSLSHTTKMNFFGMDLAISAAQAIKIGLLIAIPYLLLLVVILLTGLYQNRQLQARNKSAAAANPQQQMLMKIMPFFLPVFSFGFPSGLALYWATQNVCRIGTNAYITRSVYRKEHEKDGGGDGGSGSASRSGRDGSSGGKARSKAAPKGSSPGEATGQGASTRGTKSPPTKDASTKDAPTKGTGAVKASNGTDRAEGTSVKSQKARRNAADDTSGRRSGSGSKRSTNPRRSGESRGSAKNRNGDAGTLGHDDERVGDEKE